VRELRTLVERLHVLCGRDAMFADSVPGEDDDIRIITPDDLIMHGGMRAHHDALESRDSIVVGPAAIRLAELKLETVNDALSACDGNMSRAASTLGVHRSTLYRWLQAHQRMSA
jgi:DNA-binding NtrC family response regulator